MSLPGHDSRSSLLRVEQLSVSYPVHQGWLRPATDLIALQDVSFELAAGETLGVVGESGCGKSTLARALVQLVVPRSGSISWLGQGLDGRSRSELRALRSGVQIVFQDPLASLDPRMTVLEILSEPLREFRPEVTSQARAQAAVAMLERVGLSSEVLRRYPHEFSGGQCQRIGIARALILGPRLLVCDEPVSSLDVSVQAQIINLLKQLQRELNLSMIFISHNLALVRHISQRVLVLYLGRVMEFAGREELFRSARHPYTQMLLGSIPVPDPVRARVEPASAPAGEVPSPLQPPSGCVFRTRCRWAQAKCAAEVQALQQIARDHQVACWRWREIAHARDPVG
jgi:oligopeptide transport system ATP-binding protein